MLSIDSPGQTIRGESVVIMRAVSLFIVFTAFGGTQVLPCPTAGHLLSPGHMNNETQLLCLGLVHEEV